MGTMGIVFPMEKIHKHIEFMKKLSELVFRYSAESTTDDIFPDELDMLFAWIVDVTANYGNRDCVIDQICVRFPTPETLVDFFTTYVNWTYSSCTKLEKIVVNHYLPLLDESIFAEANKLS